MADQIDDKFQEFLKGVINIIDVHMETHFPTLKDTAIVEYKTGRKYYKVIKGNSVFCFVNRQNGDVLKAASWAAPAAHARGNIFDDDNGLSRITPYGPEYL